MSLVPLLQDSWEIQEEQQTHYQLSITKLTELFIQDEEGLIARLEPLINNAELLSRLKDALKYNWSIYIPALFIEGDTCEIYWDEFSQQEIETICDAVSNIEITDVEVIAQESTPEAEVVTSVKRDTSKWIFAALMAFWKKASGSLVYLTQDFLNQQREKRYTEALKFLLDDFNHFKNTDENKRKNHFSINRFLKDADDNLLVKLEQLINYKDIVNVSMLSNGNFEVQGVTFSNEQWEMISTYHNVNKPADV